MARAGRITHCAECNTPVTRTGTEGGFVCTPCGYTPSMQDTFIMMVCPDDGGKLIRMASQPGGKPDRWHCPTCKENYD